MPKPIHISLHTRLDDLPAPIRMLPEGTIGYKK
jgi:hypothetical protein